MDEIVITGDVVSLRAVNEVRKISTEDFYKSLSRMAGFRTPILPERVIFYGCRESHNIYITHCPPQVRELHVEIDDVAHDFKVKMPHLYFVHEYQYSAFVDLYVFAAKQQIFHTNDPLYNLPLRNLYSDNKVCLGDDLSFDLEGRMSGKIVKTENYFWNSTFNTDLAHIYEDNKPVDWDGDALACWETLSRNDDFDPCRVNWKHCDSWDTAINKILGIGQ